jgi:hypothetical protein
VLDPALPPPPAEEEVVEARLLRRDSRTGVSSTTSAAWRSDSSSHPACAAADRKRGLRKLLASFAAAARRGADLGFGLSAASLAAAAIPRVETRCRWVGKGKGEEQRSEISKWRGIKAGAFIRKA